MPEKPGADPIGGHDLLSAEQEVLARARETAQRITERVRKTLAGNDPPGPSPRGEQPPPHPSPPPS